MRLTANGGYVAGTAWLNPEYPYTSVTILHPFAFTVFGVYRHPHVQLTFSAGTVTSGNLTAELDSGTIRGSFPQSGTDRQFFQEPDDPDGLSDSLLLVPTPFLIGVQEGNYQTALAGTALPVLPAVVVHDAAGPAADVTVNWAVASGGGTVSAATSKSGPDGVARVSWTLAPTDGIQSLKASPDGSADVEAVIYATAKLHTLTLQVGDGQTAVVVRNAAGAAAAVAVNWSVTGGGGSVSSYTTTSGSDGVASVAWTLGATPGPQTLRATTASLFGPPVDFSATAMTGPGERLAYRSSPNVVTATTVITPPVEVSIQDALGNVVPAAADVTLAITPGTGVAGQLLGGTLTRPAVGGVATFTDLTIDGIGNGYTLTATAAGLPSAVSPGFAVRGPGSAMQVAAGGDVTCGLTSGGLASGGLAYCWGDGQIGDGAWHSSSVAAPVAGGLAFSQLVVGSNHACGLAVGGLAYCWGSNYAGQLGDGTATYRLVPTPAGGGLAFAELTAGDDHTCGLTSAGLAYCWGANDSGQVGDGSTTSRESAVPVGGGLAFTQLAAGGAHTCGLTSGGSTSCWGDNLFGQLGDGSTTNRVLPALTSGGLTFTQLAAGSDHTCGLTSGGLRSHVWPDERRPRVLLGTQSVGASWRQLQDRSHLAGARGRRPPVRPDCRRAQSHLWPHDGGHGVLLGRQLLRAVATVSWTLGHGIGSKTMQATTTYLLGSPVTFTATATAGTARR